MSLGQEGLQWLWEGLHVFGSRRPPVAGAWTSDHLCQSDSGHRWPQPSRAQPRPSREQTKGAALGEGRGGWRGGLVVDLRLAELPLGRRSRVVALLTATATGAQASKGRGHGGAPECLPDGRASAQSMTRCGLPAAGATTPCRLNKS